MTLPLGNVLQPLIDVFRAVLVFFHDTIGLGWGVSIIAMTVLIRALLIPLTLKQFRSMAELAKHQPEIKKLQQKYKEDKQRLNQEMMGFYKEHKINPLASCLPLAAQMPVFISLFYMLRKDLRHEICPGVNPVQAAVTHPCGGHGNSGFLFIHDLTDKATGGVLVALIILYVGSQLASSLLMSVSQDKMQRNLMLFLPLIFVTFVIRFPAGLLVYWITTNLWTIVQQYIVRKRVGPIRPVTAPAAGGGGGAGGFLERLRAGPAGPTPALADGGAAETGAKVTSTNARAVSGPPPPPPRQRKKKRSGRRR